MVGIMEKESMNGQMAPITRDSLPMDNVQE